ncbi:glycerol-3-phosphate 1-O-acyltransferase PlsY [Oricola thermophila]|uniref:Glycerol-3-phosphate acyltransferase n=1 Tax=Oricola thermophila TaxID=2742145 RepID=A0A6N1VG84_9HYPH|nr:glycerol-3-phosphate 1-O-acyltransferase PlsY [Oricola thermophila]QKV17987.1 glycerol-3-phosphate 1-O-acyltransferase PlsY [Oricola thermophila]
MDFTDTSSVALIVSFAIGYLSGSVPYGLLLTRMAGLGDVRNIGSGNIGATNVLRTGNKKLAALTLLLDALKGMVPVMLARHFLGMDAAILAGLGAFLGHLYPAWLKFRGGKGVATFAGISLGYSWHVLAPFAIVWIAMAFIFRYSSLAALTASVVTTASVFYVGQTELGLLYVVLTVLVFWKHRQNISRLLSGNESRIGQKG